MEHFRGAGMRSGLGLLAAMLLASLAHGQTVTLPQLIEAPKTAECKVIEEWATPAEKSCYATTPDYAETMAYLRRVEAAAPQQVKIETFGKTGEGRELDIVI